ncbi:MAG: DUF4215 domain-containing protein, partial [Candidatus Peribacteraceae bacterium]|nr:DUF4215 domain-containing protein [Candidatus Peribacteraceae bacterium]
MARTHSKVLMVLAFLLVTSYVTYRVSDTYWSLFSAQTTLPPESEQVTIKVLSGPAEATAAPGQKDISLMKFSAYAGGGQDIVLNKAVVAAAMGSPLDMERYSLWVDGNGDGVTDTRLSDGAANGPIPLPFMQGGSCPINKCTSTATDQNGRFSITLTGLNGQSSPECSFGRYSYEVLGGQARLVGAAGNVLTFDSTVQGKVRVTVTDPSYYWAEFDIGVPLPVSPSPFTNNLQGDLLAQVSGGTADLSISMSGPAAVRSGDTVLYTITIMNAGPSNAANVSTLGRVPSGLTFQQKQSDTRCRLASGYVMCRGIAVNGKMAQNITVGFTANANVCNLKYVTNVVQMTSGIRDPNMSNNMSKPVTTKVDCSKEAAPGASSFSSRLPDNCRYDSAAGANIGNVFTSGQDTCFTYWDAFGSSRPGSKVYYTGVLIRTYGTSSSSLRSSLYSSGASSSRPVADLGLVLSAPQSVAPGGLLILTLDYTNNGPNAAQNATVNYPIPSGLQFRSASDVQNCRLQGAYAVCGPMTIDAGVTRRVFFTLSAPATAACASTIRHTANVTSGVSDLNPNNNTAFNINTLVSCSSSSPGVCGDGMQVGSESCDDGNRISSDGCSSTCAVESGFTCVGQPSVCQKCGNARVEGREGCDDGNVISGDGCSSTCTPEVGCTCVGSPSACACPRPLCGNGRLEASEQCDDANIMVGDGCSNTCAVETGWMCGGAPSLCRRISVSSSSSAACAGEGQKVYGSAQFGSTVCCSRSAGI